jgi:myosin heavy subunit
MIQFHFNEVIFSEETAMYAAEGVPTESVVFEDNAECVKLIEGGTLCAAAVSVWPVCLVVSVV